jgi:hypothetical protein
MKGKLVLIVVGAGLAGAGWAQPDLIKRGAAITVKVESYPEAQKALAELVRRHGGTAADRHRVASEKGRHSGWSRMRVPKATLDAFLADTRQLGKVYGERLSLDDRKEQYVSLGKRAERLKQHEQRLAGILQSGRRLRGSDILYVQERLFRASVDEDMLLQQREMLASTAGTSSVVVMLFEPTPIKDEPRGAAGHAKAAVEGALRELALSVLGFLGTLLHLIVYGLIAWVLWLVFRKPLARGMERLRTWTDPTPKPKAAPPVTPAE